MADIRRVRLFAEPLIPVGLKPSAEQNRKLAAVLEAHARRSVGDDFSALEKLIGSERDSPYAPSLLFNLGMDYLHTARYSRAIPALEQAWAALKAATEPEVKKA